MRGSKNSLGLLADVPGVTNVVYSKKGRLITFSDGSIMRVKATKWHELTDELERTKRRVKVLTALAQEAALNGR